MNDYYIAPDGAHDATPSIVAMMHLTGVDRSMRDAADRLAQAGFAVIVPDLFARFDAPAPDDGADISAYVPYAKQITTGGINEDIERALARLRAAHPNTATAVAGFCMGGRIAMVRAAGYSHWFKAAATWYGFADDIDPDAVDIPVIGSFGAADVHIPAEQVRSFFDRVPGETDLKIYEGAQHGFFHKESAYDAEAAADSLRRTAAFLMRYLS